jgi:hypothetical protein
MPGYKKGLMYDLMSTTHKAKGRLLYYYPVQEGEEDNWIGWHNDRYGQWQGVNQCAYLFLRVE